ncbi:MAG: hypothetical protein ABL867_08245 [Rickettsiales bacterium]
MKKEIKAAAEIGNAATEEYRKNAIERTNSLTEAAGKGANVPSYIYPDIPSAPDRNLDLDKLLNLPEGKKTSANPANDKFATIMEGVSVSPSIILASNAGLVYPSLPRNGQRSAIEV